MVLADGRLCMALVWFSMHLAHALNATGIAMMGGLVEWCLVSRWFHSGQCSDTYHVNGKKSYQGEYPWTKTYARLFLILCSVMQINCTSGVGVEHIVFHYYDLSRLVRRPITSSMLHIMEKGVININMPPDHCLLTTDCSTLFQQFDLRSICWWMSGSLTSPAQKQLRDPWEDRSSKYYYFQLNACEFPYVQWFSWKCWLSVLRLQSGSWLCSNQLYTGLEGTNGIGPIV